MKEAAGEANMTVVTIIIIGVVVALATPIIKNLVNQSEKRGKCVNNGGTWYKGKCNYDQDSLTGNGTKGNGTKGDAGAAKQ